MKIRKRFKIDKLDKKKIIRSLAVVLAIVIVVSVGFIVLSKWEKADKNSGAVVDATVSNKTITYKGEEYSMKRNVDTILVIGLDETSEEIADHNESYNNSQEADFLTLFVFDNKNLTYSALQINRDTMADMDTYDVKGNKSTPVYQQIALSHTYGDGKKQSCKNTVNAVKGLLDNIDIEGYIAVPMDFVAQINDLVGGVEVKVIQDLSMIDPELIEGETVTLSGNQALTYVRTRYGLDDSSNATRMERQQQYLEAFFSQAVKAAESDKDLVDNFLNSDTMNSVEANNINKVQDIARNITEYEYTEIYTLTGESKPAKNNTTGQENMEFYPDEDSIQEVIIKLLYEPVIKK